MEVNILKRTLGTQGFESSGIGYGAMGISMAYGDSDEPDAADAIGAAYDAGVTHFDTAELGSEYYSPENTR